MTVKSGIALLLSLLLLLTQNGCTAMLWSDENVAGFRQPAPDPDLHVFQSTQRNDFLVVYREQSESNERIQTRSYWLIKNNIRITRDQPPMFVSQKESRNLPAIPIFNTPPLNVETNNFYAVYGTNLTIALFSTNREVGTYTLPAYNKGRSTAEKIALTPLTVTADAAILAGICGLIILCAQASGN